MSGQIDLPAPLVPADVDVRGMPFMPLDTARLLDSDLYALSNGNEFKAAVTLWCKSWQQVPAGSLPDDDRILARLSGAGARSWPRLKAMAMRGFTLCSDGRFYHPVVAEKAREAWAHRLKQREKAAKRWQGHGDATASPAAHPAADATASPAAMQGTGTAKVQKSNSSEPPINRAAAVAVLLRDLEKARGKPSKITSADPRVVAWADVGVTDEQLREAHALAVADRGAKGDPMPINAGFLDVFVGKLLNPGTAPARAVTPASIDWYRSDAGWQSKARELGIVEADFLRLQARVCVALGSGPWVDSRNATLQRLINEIQEAA